METLQDLIFATRNRAYGAYALRTGYTRTLRRAVFLGISVCSLGLITPVLLAHYNPAAKRPHLVPASLLELPPPPDEPTVVPPPPPPPAEVPPVASTQFLKPEITPDPTTDELPPTQEELQKAPASDLTREGTLDPNDFAEIPAEAPSAKTVVVEIKPNENVDRFVPVEQQPEFPGGAQALGQFLRQQLRFPEAASRSGISGRVYVAFVVRADGSIADASIQKGIGFGCDEEALRVINRMPRWKPGRQSGRAVAARFVLPIGFVLE